MTPEQLRDWADMAESASTGQVDRVDIYRGYAAALEEVGRLAARVRELEKELQAHRVHLVEAIYGQPCPTPRQWEQMQEVAVKAMGARGSKP